MAKPNKEVREEKLEFIAEKGNVTVRHTAIKTNGKKAVHTARVALAKLLKESLACRNRKEYMKNVSNGIVETLKCDSNGHKTGECRQTHYCDTADRLLGVMIDHAKGETARKRLDGFRYKYEAQKPTAKKTAPKKAVKKAVKKEAKKEAVTV